MLPIKSVRELVGPDCTLTDQQLEDERNRLYALARAMLSAHRSARSSPPALEHRLPSDRQQGAPKAPPVVLEFKAGATRPTVGHAGLRERLPEERKPRQLRPFTAGSRRRSH